MTAEPVAEPTQAEVERLLKELERYRAKRPMRPQIWILSALLATSYGHAWAGAVFSGTFSAVAFVVAALAFVYAVLVTTFLANNGLRMPPPLDRAEIVSLVKDIAIYRDSMGPKQRQAWDVLKPMLEAL